VKGSGKYEISVRHIRTLLTIGRDDGNSDSFERKASGSVFVAGALGVILGIDRGDLVTVWREVSTFKRRCDSRSPLLLVTVLLFRVGCECACCSYSFSNFLATSRVLQDS
jgi:hypothetical protein